MSQSTVNVLVVHPIPLVILAIKTIIHANPQLQYMGAAHEPIWLEDDIDLVVMDANEAHFDWVHTICNKEHAVHVVMLTSSSDPSLTAKAIRNGVTGYVSSRCSPAELAEAMINVSANMNYVSEEFATQLYASYAAKHQREELLTSRQLEILNLLAKGLSNSEIGEICSISGHTVRNHLQTIYRQLQVGSRAAAIAKAVKMQIISIK